MTKYEWITLDIYDPSSSQDIWDLSTVFDDSSLDQYMDLFMRSPFPFVIRKQLEEKGAGKSIRYAVPIGFLFLVLEDEKSDILFMTYGIIKEEREKGFMSWTLHIFNHKLIGNTETCYEWKRKYEKLINHYRVINRVLVNDVNLNRIAIKNGNFIMSDGDYNYYEETLAISLDDARIDDDIKKIKKLINEKK